MQVRGLGLKFGVTNVNRPTIGVWKVKIALPESSDALFPVGRPLFANKYALIIFNLVCNDNKVSDCDSDLLRRSFEFLPIRERRGFLKLRRRPFEDVNCESFNRFAIDFLRCPQV